MTNLTVPNLFFSKEEQEKNTKEAYAFYLENYNKGNVHSILVVDLFRKNPDLIEKLSPRELHLGFQMLNQLIETNGANNFKQSLCFSFGKNVGKELGAKLETFDTKPKLTF